MPVVADPDRITGARRAMRDGATTVVVDDGFQHRRMARDLDVVLLSVDDPFPGGVMPVGPYREPASSLARADVILLTRRRASLDAARAMVSEVEAVPGVRPGIVVGCVRLASDGVVPLQAEPSASDAPADAPAETLRGGAVALTAIARPEAFRRDVAGLATGPVELVAYADHHDFTDADVKRARERAGARPIVVTEKDAVKLGGLADALGDAWVLRERVVWDWGEDALRGRLVDLAGPAPEAAG
jgi:tetraacyldisaccharide 4'-kinase